MKQKNRKLNRLQQCLRNLARRIDRLEPSSEETRYMSGFYAGTFQAQEEIWKWIRKGAGQLELHKVLKQTKT
jgi:hypothetical protein